MITLLAILGGLLIPKEWVQHNIAIFAVALILGGIPHGASDYLIFQRLLAQKDSLYSRSIFSLLYLSIIVAYGFLWWFYPLVAFLFFIVLSLYHFGQSNWEYVNFPNSFWQAFTYLLWGGLVVGFPVLVYHEQASLIIFEITGSTFSPNNFRWPILFGLLMFNILNITYLWEAKCIDKSGFNKEIINLLVLVSLFLTTPLLIGFGVYFVFWHSLGTIFDQLAILKQTDHSYDLKKYLKKLVPFTIMAFVGLGLFYWLLGDRMDYGLNLGALFLFISIITVPHSILMDRFYLTKTD